jgi:hypothetical protein
MRTKYYSETPKGRDYLGYMGINRKIILKWSRFLLEKLDSRSPG